MTAGDHDPVAFQLDEVHNGATLHPGPLAVAAALAAAAAARILNLDARQTRHALGIAGSQAAGLVAAQM
ncbi:MAG: hypothetical protein HYY79_11100 [Betaproteobacteria bacterium]|nr:hypothetical protein [Betaproteobacteria bacterium]